MPARRLLVKPIINRPNCAEFDRSFKPLHYINKISGLSPFEMQEVNGTFITRRSRFGLTQTVALIVLYTGILCFLTLNDTTVFKLDGVSLVLENITLFALEFTFYIIVLSVIIEQKDYLQIIKRLLELDTLLFELGEEIDYEKEFKRNVILVGLCCTINLIIGVSQYVKLYQPGLIYLIHTLLWFPPLSFMHIMLYQFSIMVFSLKVRCSRLNNFVSKVINCANEDNLSILPNVKTRNKKAEVRYCSIEDTIWNVSVIYDIIFDLCKSINRIFSFQTTVGLATTSILITIVIYKSARSMPEFTYQWFLGWLAIDGMALLSNIAVTFIVIYCCSETKSETDQVAILLHKVKPKTFEHHGVIRTFSLRCIHQKVQFTACGLFHLDYTFIYLVISSITTYILIIVQFD